MPKTLLDLANDLDRISPQIQKAASDAAVFYAITVTAELAYKTPVDTSLALSNWVVTLGSANGSRIPPHFPGEKGNTQASSAAETIAQAKAVLSAKVPGQSIFITNNQPYIRRLNDGSSSQQPAGFIERAELIGRKAAERRGIKVSSNGR